MEWSVTNLVIQIIAGIVGGHLAAIRMLMWFASGIVMMYVGFPQPAGQERGTDYFPPFFKAAPVSHGCRPGHRESALIFDRELELQVLRRTAARS
jgi:hypothetical protein